MSYIFYPFFKKSRIHIAYKSFKLSYELGNDGKFFDRKVFDTIE